MPFDDERTDIIFTLRMALLSCRVSPKAERHDHLRRIQAEHILMHLERAGYRILKAGEERGVRGRRTLGNERAWCSLVEK